ncbi:MAG: T9SS type A sorting domain-containing protein [Cyclobacteriaceae bacterium]|nr:T9SS type A sorting domain-containing protein [Cyclobacteriaceae bacterium]
MRIVVFTFFFICTHVSVLQAQDRCGTVENEKKLLQNHPAKETPEQFEKWMSTQVAKTIKNQNNQRTQSAYTIPVVVHVIHNGESIGTGVNISEAQILSQLKVLNNDFNRQNADQTNTPTLFQPVAGSMDIEFVLAKQDPDGLPTTGIVRVKGSKTSWVLNDNYTLKSQSYWPAEQYLNIWVTNLTDYLGFAQSPVSPLAGLEEASNDRLTDGVVVNYRVFGSIDDGAFSLKTQYNKGRTLTHEMGHFFGLRHIWGDVSSCSGTDYVADTPVQSSSTSGCPVHPQTSCSTTKMFQNYLDYTDDACMNLFTQGQADRMITILLSSPRRKELPNSPALQTPVSVADDLGIKKIISPGTTACSGLLTPSVLVRNYGNNTITNAQLQLKRNNSVIETKNIILSLAPDAEQQIDFNFISLTSASATTFDFTITFANSHADNNAVNNLKSISTSTSTPTGLPLTESFASFPSSWSKDNPDGLTTWQTTLANGTSAMYINLYDYAEMGATDKIITPQLDLSNTPTAALLFDRAYAQYDGTTGEGLKVLASTGCRFDNSPDVLFNKTDAALATATSRLSRFVPASTEWKTEVISLSQYAGRQVQLAFESMNANGNNLFIKNVRFVTSSILDLAIVQLESPSFITCLGSPTPAVRIRNNGNIAITSFSVSLSVNGGSNTIYHFGNQILPNEELVVNLSPMILNGGTNQYTISVLEPNGSTDIDPSNDSRSYQIAFNTANEVIPLREKFETASKNDWVIIGAPQQTTWSTATTNYNTSLVYNGFTNTKIGEEGWLISPILNLTDITKASAYFDISYAKRSTGNETLRVLASTDCEHFTTELFSASGVALSNIAQETSWLPSVSSAWTRQQIILSSLAGQPNVRLAFVATNGNGNNLYLDNIEFFANEDSQPSLLEVPYSVYGGLASPLKITFNFDTRQSAFIQVFNVMGQLISELNLTNVLNQTFPIEMPNQGTGIYLIRVQTDTHVSTKKVYWGN